jgi:hypothetical protein
MTNVFVMAKQSAGIPEGTQSVKYSSNDKTGDRVKLPIDSA